MIEPGMERDHLKMAAGRCYIEHGAQLVCVDVVTFHLNEYLAARRSVIDRALERHLERQPGHAQALWQAMRYGLFSGGKRVRPILTLAAGEMFGAKRKMLLPFACAIEMIHTYSLIHDDLPALDDDHLRRGVPTVHKVFGEGMALLAGDALLTEAFHLMSAPAARSLEPGLLLDLIHELGHAAGIAGLVGGQAFDLEAEEKEIDLAMVEYMHVRKTGALILASLRMGARVGGAKLAELKKISRYGEFLGLAFQIADDVLDAAGQEEKEESGRKEVKKATYPSVVGLVQTKERLTDLTRQAVQSLASFGPEAEPLRAMASYVAHRALGSDVNSHRQEIHG